ncbi:hypothetical protein Tco_1522957 [Tanacetum coccineum]
MISVVAKVSGQFIGNTNLDDSLSLKLSKGKGFHAVLHYSTVIPPRANVSFTGIDELAIRNKGNPEEDSKDYAILNMNPKGREEYGKGTIKTSCIDFEKVSYVEELKFNLLSVSQICDKKHNVLFTDKECLILSPKFKFVETDLCYLELPRKI